MSRHSAWSRYHASIVADKATYSDAQFRAYSTCIALAAERGGVFRSRRALEDLLSLTIRSEPVSELVAFLISEGDLRVRRGGNVELVGWVGAKVDTTAADRQRRRRERLAQVSDGAPESLHTNVTQVSTPDRLSVVPSSDVTRDKGDVTRDTIYLSPSDNTTTGGEPTNGVRGPGEGDDEPEWPVLSWLAAHHATVPPTGNGYHRTLVRDVERVGAPRVIAALEECWGSGSRTPRALVLGASNLLDPIPNPKDIRRRQAEDAAAAQSRREAERTRQLIRERQQYLEDDAPPPRAYDRPEALGDIIGAGPQVRERHR